MVSFKFLNWIIWRTIQTPNENVQHKWLLGDFIAKALVKWPSEGADTTTSAIETNDGAESPTAGIGHSDGRLVVQTSEASFYSGFSARFA